MQILVAQQVLKELLERLVQMGIQKCFNTYVHCIILLTLFFSLLGEPGAQGSQGLAGNYPPVSLSHDGKCVPCAHGPKGNPGPVGVPGQPVNNFVFHKYFFIVIHKLLGSSWSQW